MKMHSTSRPDQLSEPCEIWAQRICCRSCSTTKIQRVRMQAPTTNVNFREVNADCVSCLEKQLCVRGHDEAHPEKLRKGVDYQTLLNDAARLFHIFLALSHCIEVAQDIDAGPIY